MGIFSSLENKDTVNVFTKDNSNKIGSKNMLEINGCKVRRFTGDILIEEF